MLIRVTGRSSGIAEYLVNGQKQDRELSRDELDERVILDGDLELTDAIIKGMDNSGDRCLHITLAFKEDVQDEGVLKLITGDFKQFAMSAYDADEFNFYAEAHLPKVKSYTNRKTDELVERKPHIHILIPRANLLSGTLMELFYKPVLNKATGLMEVPNEQLKWIDAFQESVNLKYGFSSPKDNRRLEFTGASEIISRYKGDVFQGSSKDLKARILSDVLDRKITDYDSFKTLLAEHGATRPRNAGKPAEYQYVKPAGQAEGVNLRDYVFSREFIETPDNEKRRILAEEGRQHYVTQQQPKPPAPELAALLDEWHEVRALELKYINSGNRKLYAAYRAADRGGKRAILADRAERFYAKHQAGRAFGVTFNDSELSTPRPERDRGRAERGWRLAAARLNQSNSSQPGRALVSEPVKESPPLLYTDVPDYLACRTTNDSRAHGGHELGAGKRRSADSVTGQLLADLQESATVDKAANLAEFAQIKRELDARRLLDHLSKSHGVIPEKYEVTKGKDGGDRIKAGSRNLNVSDFLTQELHLSFTEAAPILRQVYAAQQGREVSEPMPAPRRAPRRELWEAFRKARPELATQKAAEWEAQRQSERDRRAAIRDTYQVERRAIQSDRSRPAAERKVAMSVTRMAKVAQDMALREAVSAERKRLRESNRQPLQERYRVFLADLANRGDEEALAELRRQRDTQPAPHGHNRIEGIDQEREDAKKRRAPVAPALSYTVDRAGNVTYYADLAKCCALVIDSGQQVTVTANDSQAVEVGLRLAVQKFGPALKIDGSAEFRQQVIEAALKTGLRVEFDNKAMNDELQRRRAERDELQARGRAFIDAEKAKGTTAATPVPMKVPEPVQERTQEPKPPKAKTGPSR